MRAPGVASAATSTVRARLPPERPAFFEVTLTSAPRSTAASSRRLVPLATSLTFFRPTGIFFGVTVTVAIATVPPAQRHQNGASETTMRRQEQLSMPVIVPSASRSIAASTTHGASGHGGLSGSGPLKLSREGWDEGGGARWVGGDRAAGRRRAP